jgi:hypothetical protein
MTALRSLVLGVALCGCGAHADNTGLFEHARPVRASEQQPAASAPSSAMQASSRPPSVQTASAPGFAQPLAPPPDSSGPALIADPEAPPDAGPPPLPPSEPPRPNPAPPPALHACFEYLGDWITCENAGWPHVEQTSAPDLESCMQLCQQREDCTAVTDYFWLGRPDLGCWLYTSTCNAPAGGPWQEEDGGRQYKKQSCEAP